LRQYTEFASQCAARHYLSRFYGKNAYAQAHAVFLRQL
jgi:hypothetical protein